MPSLSQSQFRAADVHDGDTETEEDRDNDSEASDEERKDTMR